MKEERRDRQLKVKPWEYSEADRGREWLTRETEMQQLFEGEGVGCF